MFKIDLEKFNREFNKDQLNSKQKVDSIIESNRAAIHELTEVFQNELSISGEYLTWEEAIAKYNKHRGDLLFQNGKMLNCSLDADKQQSALLLSPSSINNRFFNGYVILQN